MSLKSQNPWIVCLAAASFFSFEFFQVNMFNALDPELIRTFHTDGKTLSMLSSVYFYGNILLLLPAGMLLDRWSTRKIVLTAMLLSLVGTTIFACATTLWTAALGRFLVGISGGPFCFLSTIRLASRWFPENKLAAVTGIIVAVGMLGGLLSQTPFTILVDSFGWRTALAVDLMGGLLIYLLLVCCVHDCPADKVDDIKQQQLKHNNIGFVTGFKAVTFKLQNWSCGTFASLLNLPIFLLGALWGSLYLTQIHGLSRLDASYVTSMLYIGMLIGAPFFGSFSDYIKSRKIPMFIGTVFCLVSIIIVMRVPDLTLNNLIILFLIMGFSSSAQIIAYPTVAESNPPHLTGSAEGLAAVLIMSGGAVFQPIFGWLVEMQWDGKMLEQIPVYSIGDYTAALLLIPGTLIGCLVMLMLIKETRSRLSLLPPFHKILGA